MKKTLFAAAALSILALASCSQSAADRTATTAVNTDNDVVEAYTGMIPAADVDGVRYTVVLDYDDDSNGKEGEFEMIQTYVEGDTTVASGVSDKASFFSKGDFTRPGDNAAADYIKLQSSTASGPGEVTYFLVTSDSTIVLVGPTLQPAADTGLNYTLKRAE